MNLTPLEKCVRRLEVEAADNILLDDIFDTDDKSQGRVRENAIIEYQRELELVLALTDDTAEYLKYSGIKEYIENNRTTFQHKEILRMIQE
ncbi:MAG: hypothetical protein EHM73_15160 [Chroococcales cyanobacterium metabat2.561]|nr:MAG: hypothetical protein EHM73_15160 [Chroococcales cyanobacterium metabat2.561]